MSAATPPPVVPPLPMAADPQRHWVAYGLEDDHLVITPMVKEPRPAEERARHAVPEGIASLSASRDGRWLALGHRDTRSVALWAPLDETLTQWHEISRAELPGSATPALSVQVAFSPTEDTLLAAACGTHLQVLRLDMAELQRLLQGFQVQAQAGTVAEDVNAAPSGITTRLTLVAAGPDRWAFEVISGGGRERLPLDALRPTDPPDAQMLAELTGLRPGGVALRPQRPHEAGRAALRDRLLPRGLAELPLVRYPHGPVVLDVHSGGERFALLPWEWLLSHVLAREGLPRPLLRQAAPEKPLLAPTEPLRALLLELPSGYASRAERVAAARVLDQIQRQAAGHLAEAAIARPKRPSPRGALEALYDSPEAVLVLAGVPDDEGKGLKLDAEHVLGPQDIRQRRQLPRLLLVACGGHPRLAAALGQLGVPACVAPQWAVDEEGATVFCTTFLEAMLGGQTLDQAVARANAEAFSRQPRGSAWMAYSVYGDPDFKLTLNAATQAPEPPAAAMVPGRDVARLHGPEGEELMLGAATASELLAVAREQKAEPQSRWLRNIDVLNAQPKGQRPRSLQALAEAVDKRFPPGLIRLTPAGFADPPAKPETLGGLDGPVLVLVHGLMGDVESGFAPLWQRQWSGHWERLFMHYRGQVYAFQHATLQADPLDRALALLKALPPRASVDLVTLFDGGLVGELLVQAMAGTLTAKGDRHWQAGTQLLMHLASQRALQTVREVRVGAPMSGSLFAAKQMDMLLSMLAWRMPKVQQDDPTIKAFMLEALRDRQALASVPGLGSLAFDTSLGASLFQPFPEQSGTLYALAATNLGTWADRLLSLLVGELAKTGEHDGLVLVASALAHAPRSQPVRTRVLEDPGVGAGPLLDDPRTVSFVFEALLDGGSPDVVGRKSRARKR